jgi:hypothetical protein
MSVILASATVAKRVAAIAAARRATIRRRIAQFVSCRKFARGGVAGAIYVPFDDVREGPSLARGSVGRELAPSALRAEGDQLAHAVAPVAPLLEDRGELVDLAPTLGAANVSRKLGHDSKLSRRAGEREGVVGYRRRRRAPAPHST